MRPSNSCRRPPWWTQGSCAAGRRWLRTGCGRGALRARRSRGERPSATWRWGAPFARSAPALRQAARCSQWLASRRRRSGRVAGHGSGSARASA
eukprot:4739327-Lingulodinium_polyedra.AAC.1